jgi:hypothetical protein
MDGWHRAIRLGGPARPEARNPLFFHPPPTMLSEFLASGVPLIPKRGGIGVAFV